MISFFGVNPPGSDFSMLGEPLVRRLDKFGENMFFLAEIVQKPEKNRGANLRLNGEKWVPFVAAKGRLKVQLRMIWSTSHKKCKKLEAVTCSDQKLIVMCTVEDQVSQSFHTRFALSDVIICGF